MRGPLVSRFRAALVRRSPVVVFVAIPAHADDLKAFAAASLKNALEEVATRYSDAPNRPKAVFVRGELCVGEADRERRPGRYLHLRGRRLDGLRRTEEADRPATRVDLLGNRLVLIAPTDSTVKDITKGFPLAPSSRRGPSRGRRSGLRSRGEICQSGARVLGSVEPGPGKSARAENVRAALAFVSRGETPLGIVYATDAKAYAEGGRHDRRASAGQGRSRRIVYRRSAPPPAPTPTRAAFSSISPRRMRGLCSPDTDSCRRVR